MTAINAESQKLTPTAYIELFRFDTSSLGGPIMYFTQAARVEHVVSFGGIQYTPVDVEFGGMETNASGSLPRPHIKVAASNGVFSSIINRFGDLKGCPFARVRTFERFLDDGATPDPTEYYGPDLFRVARKVYEGKEYIEFELASNIDQQGKQLPGRQVIRDTCGWRYRRHIGGNAFDYARVKCPYTGPACFDESDNPTTPDKDRCSRKVSGCELRFGKGNRLPFGGFPGAARVKL